MARNIEDAPMLVAQTGPLNGQRWNLQRNILIGRDESCDVIIPSRQVSRYHARLSIFPDGILLEDLASKNGTHCNGQPVAEPVYLQDGDVIQIAIAQQLIFLSSDATLPLDMPLDDTRDSEAGKTLLRLDKRSRRVWVGRDELLPPLSVSQFQLLELLYDNPGEVVTRNQMIQAIWREEDAAGVSEQALDALIRRLRDRLASQDVNHPFLITVRGHGLRLDNPLLGE
ncbi:MAG TPA: FHA domain-containing protein [Anaerolineales bacterium]|nr:FHA domain-containing protein [Anaerolineales bacterium]